METLTVVAFGNFQRVGLCNFCSSLLIQKVDIRKKNCKKLSQSPLDFITHYICLFVSCIPEELKPFAASLSAEIEADRASGYIDFQPCPLHINICSLSKDNSTQGTKSCRAQGESE